MNWLVFLLVGVFLLAIIVGVGLFIWRKNLLSVVQEQLIPPDIITKPIEYPAVSPPVVVPERPVQPSTPISPQRPTEPTIPEIPPDTRPYRLIGAADGRWFQVLDRQGSVVASLNIPTQTDIDSGTNVSLECPEGELELVGVRNTPMGRRLGPIGCSISGTGTMRYIGQRENIEQYYSLGKTCPSGYQPRTSNLLNTGINYICVSEGCKVQSDCPSGTFCSGGQCVPISDF